MQRRILSKLAFRAVALTMVALLAACSHKKQAWQASRETTFMRSEPVSNGAVDRATSAAMPTARFLDANGAAAKLVAESAPVTADRKVVRNASFELLVQDVATASEQIRNTVKRTGGFVEKSVQTNRGQSVAMTLRVPADKLDDALAEIKRAATTVDREETSAQDVTREYIDLDARLRTAQAEEQQYLLILKRAATVKDTLEVTEKLGEVRGTIEQLQGQMKYLTAQIDMATIQVALRSEAEAAVMGVHWRPLRQARVAWSEMLSGLADWADSVIAFLINLPVYFVWLVTLVVLLVVAWRILRFIVRRLAPNANWRWPWRSKPAEQPKQGD